MKKENLLDLLYYLREFSKLRNIPIRNFERQKNQNEECLWISEFQKIDGFNLFTQNSEEDEDFIIKINKPYKPSMPELLHLPEDLKTWIDLSKVTDDSNELIILKTSVDGLIIDDYPRIIKLFENYKESQYQNDLLEYLPKLHLYVKTMEEYKILNSLYNKFFVIANKTIKFDEEYELILAIGLFNYKKDIESVSLYRHIITQKVDIYKEHKDGVSFIYLSINPETNPKIEIDFIKDQDKLFDINFLSKAENDLEAFVIQNEESNSIEFLLNNYDENLKSFIEKIHPEGLYKELQEKTSLDSGIPLLSLSPAVILRKRDTRNLTQLYDNIIEQANSSNGTTQIRNFDIFTDETRTTKNLENDKIIYFPKEYNEEQEKIICEVNKSQAVLVQGPPGTGKSHTIANLISHFLATEKKVLVTAYTKRALEVLKDKLPKNIKDLTVSYLQSDSNSYDDISSSINKIIQKSESNDYDKVESQIQKDMKALNEVNTNTVGIIDILSYRKNNKSSFHKLNSYYNDNLTGLALQISGNGEKYFWYKDDFVDFEDDDLINEIVSFFNDNIKFNDIGLENIKSLLPEESDMISVHELFEYVENKKALESNYSNYNEKLIIPCENLLVLSSLMENLRDKYEELKFFQFDYKSLVEHYFEEYRINEFKAKVSKTKDVINNIDLDLLNNYGNRLIIEFDETHDLDKVALDLNILSEFFDDKTKFESIRFKCSRIFFPKRIKKRLYLTDFFSINKRPCMSMHDIRSLKDYVSLKQEFLKVYELWDIKANKSFNCINEFEFFYDFIANAILLDDILSNQMELKNNILKITQFDIIDINESNIDRLILNTKFHLLKHKIKIANYQIDKTIRYLESNEFHIIKKELLLSLYNLNSDDYDSSIIALRNFRENKKVYNQFLITKDRLLKTFPYLIDSIINNLIEKNQISELKKAIAYKDAKCKYEKLMLNYSDEELLIKLHGLETRRKEIISNSVVNKSWNYIIKSLSENTRLKKSLLAWVGYVSKVGKSEKSKKYKKYSKLARNEMNYCKEVVPCWIMPLYKVIETVKPGNNIYDVVIVDEASQLGPESLFLFHIAKKIIIVGDDKQTSPEYVGTKSNIMVPYIEKYLKNIHYKDYFGLDFSLFDIGNLFCDKKIFLREHFRCMPEIIEFSNKTYYRPVEKALYPLKQYSENRLEPLNSIYCKNGFVEGEGANILNRAEAFSLMKKLVQLIESPKYEEKTFGIISLQGHAQAKFIEELLLEYIDEKEIENRKIICGNSASFQGDERDIMFLSLVTAKNHPRKALTRDQDRRRFNVAASRAKEQIWIFHSVELSELKNQNDQRYLLLDHVLNYVSENKGRVIPVPLNKKVNKPPKPFDSWFEVQVFNDLVNKGLSVIPQYKVTDNDFRIDLVPVLKNGDKIAIECDGAHWHGRENFERDIRRQRILERCGWNFFRINDYEYYFDKEKSLAPMWEMVDELGKDNNSNGHGVPKQTTDKGEEEDSSGSQHGSLRKEQTRKPEKPLDNPSISKTKLTKLGNATQLIIDFNQAEEKITQPEIDLTYAEDVHIKKSYDLSKKYYKIKYLENNKVRDVQIVNDKAVKTNIYSHLLTIHYKSPLAKSILGKSIGDIVTIKSTKMKVEIIDICDMLYGND